MNEALKIDATTAFEDELNYAIGDRASTLRRRAGLTLAECGHIMGLSESSASLKFGGKGKWSALEVRLLADRFGVSVSVLYGDDAMPEPTRPATVTKLDTSKNAVGLGGIEPTTSTVKAGRLIPFPTRLSA